MVEALDGHMVWHVMLLLVVVKLLAVNITLGSGFSGGIFAPALFLGGMLGGAFGAVLGHVLPGPTIRSAPSPWWAWRPWWGRPPAAR